MRFARWRLKPLQPEYEIDCKFYSSKQEVNDILELGVRQWPQDVPGFDDRQIRPRVSELVKMVTPISFELVTYDGASKSCLSIIAQRYRAHNIFTNIG